MLDKIIAEKKRYLAQLDQKALMKKWEKILENGFLSKDFGSAIKIPGEISLIAEIKKASPSAGILKKDFDVEQMAKIYQKAGADAISILTEKRFFLGSEDDLKKVKETASLPILRKDFIIDEFQIYESKILGADCILLIAAILGKNKLQKFLHLAQKIGLQALVEVHQLKELGSSLDSGADMIGINNRNLKNLKVSLKTTESLVRLIPKRVTKVAESGIDSYKEVKEFKDLGVDAVLVGEAIIKNPDPALKIKELLGTI